MTVSQILTLMGPTPSICGWHHQCLRGWLQDSEVSPEMSFGGAQVSHLPISHAVPHCPQQFLALDSSLLLLCMLRTLTSGSQTSRFARLAIPGLGHLLVMAEMRENPTCTTFFQAHCQALKHELVESEAKT